MATESTNCPTCGTRIHVDETCPKCCAKPFAPAPSSARHREYYILSLKHSPADGCALWWGANNAGYTKNLLTAGRYSEDRVKEMAWYYNDGTATRAVPCDTVEATVMLSVDWNKAHKSWARVPNEKLKNAGPRTPDVRESQSRRFLQ